MPYTALKLLNNRLVVLQVSPCLSLKLVYQKLRSTAKREFFDRFWRRGAQLYRNTTRTHLTKAAEKACFAADGYYSYLATACLSCIFPVKSQELLIKRLL